MMLSHCPYCDNLKSALDIDNYCSHKKRDSINVDSNAYYFSDKSISSGEHVSRFSIRAIYNGYQHYQVGNKNHVIDDEKFLVINEGEHFEHYVDQEDAVEGIIIAFNAEFLKYYLYHLNHSDQRLLDNPFDKTNASIYFYNNAYEKSEQLDGYLKSLITGIKKDQRDPIYYQSKFSRILDELVGMHHEMTQRINNINAIKGKTREELYRRLSTAKDYIDASLDQKLSIDKISQISCLSPFHFLRSFSSCYGYTPYRYILAERLKKAHFLIERSTKDLPTIILNSGFEHKRTFQRAYQKAYGITPYARLKSLRA